MIMMTTISVKMVGKCKKSFSFFGLSSLCNVVTFYPDQRISKKKGNKQEINTSLCKKGLLLLAEDGMV